MTEIREVARGDAEYPRLLEQIPDPPKRLWVRGRRLNDLPSCVAVVGSRTPTPYGEQVAEDLAADLAASGVCVVSGLARGCDGAAHRGALRPPGGKTVAVLGTGIDVCHPKSHRRLAERVCEAGSLITEFEPGTPGYPLNFVRRNRIISGLSLAVVVVQARRKSGALTTADFGLEQNREVFAVPGNVDVELSAGPHGLLREGARLCTGAGEVLSVVDPPASAQATGETGAGGDARVRALPAEQRRLYDALRTGRSLESAARTARLGPSDAAIAIVRLEISGLVVRALGHRWRQAPR